MVKTPLRYPGGKSRAIKHLKGFLPYLGDEEFEEFCEPFEGGASVSIYISQLYPELKIWINDIYTPLYNFWITLQQEPMELIPELEKIRVETVNLEDDLRHRKCKERFLQAKEELDSEDPIVSAISFYIVNKCGFSGMITGFSKSSSDKTFTLRGIEKLWLVKHLIRDWSITNLSYEDLLTNSQKTFIYHDPPYEINSSLYGKQGSVHKVFDHVNFAENCNLFTCPQLISYNDTQKVTERFSGWHQGRFKHQYSMQSGKKYRENQKKRHELVLYNYELEE